MTDSAERLMRSNNKRQLAEMLLIAEGEAKMARQAAEEARANDRQAMAYLSQCRQAVGHKGDFSSLVAKLHKMASESCADSPTPS